MNSGANVEGSNNKLPLTRGWRFDIDAGSGAVDSAKEDPGSQTFNNNGIFTATYTLTDDLGDPGPAPDTGIRIMSTAPSQEISIDRDLYEGALVRRTDTPVAAEDIFMSGSISFPPVTLTESSNRLRLSINFASNGIKQSIKIGAIGTGANRPDTFASRTGGDCTDGMNSCSHDFGPGMKAANSSGNLGDANTNVSIHVALVNAQGNFGSDFVNPFFYTAGTGIRGATPVPPPFPCGASECVVGAQFPEIADGRGFVTFDGIVVDLVFSNTSSTFAPVTVDSFQFNMLGGDLQILPPIADLSITKTNDLDEVIAGENIIYEIVASNSGPADAMGATVTNTFPEQLVNCSWTCVASAGSSCTAGPISGDINDTVDLLVGATATYTASCDVRSSGIIPNKVSNTATLSPASGTADPDDPNNSVVDQDRLQYPIRPLSLGALVGLPLMLVGISIWRRKKR